MNLVRQADLARELGVNPSSILRAVRAGRLEYADGDGKLFDLDAARSAWHGNRQRQTKTEPGAAKRRTTDTDRLITARLDREHTETELARLKLAQQRGVLVLGREAERTSFEFFRMIRNRMQALPDRLAPVLAAERDIVRLRTILAKEIAAALEDIAQIAEAA